MRPTERNYRIIMTLFTVSLVIANVLGARTITTGITIGGITFSASGAIVVYWLTFLCTDVVGEIWGKKESRRIVWYALAGQVFALLAIVLSGILPCTDAEMDAAFHMLLGQTWAFVAASIVGYVCSQTWDIFLFHALRGKIAKGDKPSPWRWVWNCASTITSQAIDTAIYVFIAFGIGLGWLFDSEMLTALIGLAIGQYVLKVCLAIIDTPFFYLFTHRWHKKEITSGSSEKTANPNG